MATFNTTYNFEQKRMGFGQALLYGALGSMGGGCFGGGYGMGMNGSLFSMMNMGIGGGCCGYGYGYSDAMMGMQFGNMISNILTGCLTMAFAGRGAAKAERQEKIDTAKNNVDSLTTKLNELNEEENNLKEIESFNIKSEVPAGIKKVFPTESGVYSDKLKTLNEISQRSNDYYIKNNVTVSGINDREITSKTVGEGNNQKTVYEYNGTQYDTKNDAEAAKEKDLNKAIENAKAKDTEKAESELQTAFDTLTDAVNKRLSEIENEISKNKTDLDKSQKELEEAAGSDVKISKKCDTEEECKTITSQEINDKNVKNYVRAFNYKFSQYCKSTGNDKKKIANEAIKIYTKINDNFTSYITDEMIRNMKIMKSFVDNDGNIKTEL